SAVAAHVVEHVKLPLLVPRDAHRLSGKVTDDVVARRRELLGPSVADPDPPPDPFAFLIEGLEARVVGPGQRGKRLPRTFVVPDRLLLGLHAGLLGRDASRIRTSVPRMVTGPPPGARTMGSHARRRRVQSHPGEI